MTNNMHIIKAEKSVSIIPYHRLGIYTGLHRKHLTIWEHQVIPVLYRILLELGNRKTELDN